MLPESTLVGVLGLGYVGLPLAQAFARRVKVLGFDINTARIAALSRSAATPGLTYSSREEDLRQADFLIVCVPTPVTEDKLPDLAAVISAAEIAGRNLKKGAAFVLESTVYPGVTEEVLKPVLEKTSGLVCGRDFKIGYSPERINPGDEAHVIDKIAKVVSGMDAETTDRLAELYGVVAASVFRARDIRTAEAAKVIENIQRDLNIALMNELSIIFSKIGISTRDVLDAAETKWNFHRYSPGLVGGHCIPVDPYYLVRKAEDLGYRPQVILAGRTINNAMPGHVVDETVKALEAVGKTAEGARVLVAGLTYKEDVPDTRETPVKGVIKGLREKGASVTGYDPILENGSAEFGVPVLKELDGQTYDAVIVTVVHRAFRSFTPATFRELMPDRPVLMDVRGAFDTGDARRDLYYWRL